MIISSASLADTLTKKQHIGRLNDTLQTADEKEFSATKAVLDCINKYSCPYLIVDKGDLVSLEGCLLLDPALCNSRLRCLSSMRSWRHGLSSGQQR